MCVKNLIKRMFEVRYGNDRGEIPGFFIFYIDK
nr:MAG TPA: restriction endonuclease [Herelleviridae sp.]